MATPRICSVVDCSKPSRALGYCVSHYNRFRSHGDPCGGRVPPGTLLAWMEQTRVAPPRDECILWPFPNSIRAGYGAINYQGKLMGAHVLMATWVHGERPGPHMVVAHQCGNRACVNPRHLRWATHAENAADMVKHGMSGRGTRNTHNKLSEADVREIRRSPETISSSQLARDFGVDPCTVMDIRKGRTWAWLV